jgi:hypothetical protein
MILKTLAMTTNIVTRTASLICRVMTATNSQTYKLMNPATVPGFLCL